MGRLWHFDELDVLFVDFVAHRIDVDAVQVGLERILDRLMATSESMTNLDLAFALVYVCVKVPYQARLHIPEG